MVTVIIDIIETEDVDGYRAAETPINLTLHQLSPVHSRPVVE